MKPEVVRITFEAVVDGKPVRLQRSMSVNELAQFPDLLAQTAERAARSFWESVVYLGLLDERNRS